mmetsp:Transcript_35890/g.61229  ORF Transcript_35890/g.61229 Transcript_35890/m.61229 type:complete len:135 (-) Transcript_35890:180-584(-)|eukprot:CAMPEP_0183715084 /NCGR_PEP_ID=MMETSP0737-20130205/9448_1 /TAXON_ID=385413 /ORGANISM="Thalassiosira miniscula, Strain CCMP1093" /LENGTH=134 /DNA_ID=CAMNT_0025944149 /DNA_START=51 /DNA_END=455 /DNA_ORIENTATION=-
MAGSKKTPTKAAAAAPKANDAKAKAKKKTKATKSTRPNFNTYIYRVLKECHPNIGITKKSMGIMNDFVIDMMDKIATEAKNDLSISRKEKTMREWHFNTATKLVLPGELKKHGISEGSKAIATFNANRSNAAKK